MGSERVILVEKDYSSFIIHHFILITIVGETTFVFPITMDPFYVIGVIKGNEER